MKNQRSLNVLLIDENKSNADFLSNLIQNNVRIVKIMLHSILEQGQLSELFKSYETKPDIVFLVEPIVGKIKFSFEVATYTNIIKSLIPSTEVIIISSPDKTTTAVEAFRSGAFDVVLNDSYAANNVINAIQRYFNNTALPSGITKEFANADFF